VRWATASSTRWKTVNNKTGEVRRLKTPALFSFIGAVAAHRLAPFGNRDGRERILDDRPGRGQVAPMDRQFATHTCWKRAGQACFAIGDVRSGSVKRVASAVGEGAMAVQFVHQYLRTFVMAT